MPATLSQQIMAKKRIHEALDKGQTPKVVDVDLIGGQEELASLLDSRSELKQVVTSLTAAEVQEAKEALKEMPEEANKESKNVRREASSTKDQDVPVSQPRKQTREERDYEEFFRLRFGPIICLLLFFALRDWEKAAFYAPSPEECSKAAGPLSRIGARLEKVFRSPAWVHVIITTSDDTVTLLYVFIGYFERIGLLDKILPVFSREQRETRKKYERAGEQNVQSAIHPEPIQPEHPRGYTGANGKPDFRAVAGFIPGPVIGAQWAAD